MAREQPCSRAVKHGRLQRARAFMQAADLLGRLLNLKTPVGYGHRLVSADDRLVAKRAAETLVERAAEVLP
jgi:hypothetical protein